MIPLRRAQVLAHRHQWDELMRSPRRSKRVFPSSRSSTKSITCWAAIMPVAREFEQAREAYLQQ